MTEKSPLGSPTIVIISAGKDPPMNARINGQKLKEKWDISTASKPFPLNTYYCGSFNICPQIL